MTDELDILGLPPLRKKQMLSEEILIEGPSFEELCKPISAKVMPARVLAMSKGITGAMKSQRIEGRR